MPVRAVRAGTRGNVGANEVTQLPGALASQLVTVRNPNAMTGGRRIETEAVTQEDYDAALASLTTALQASLATELQDPNSMYADQGPIISAGVGVGF